MGTDEYSGVPDTQVMVLFHSDVNILNCSSVGKVVQFDAFYRSMVTN